MGNNDEKRLSEVLERIIGIKEELESLEDEVRGVLSSVSSKPESQDLENAGQSAGPDIPATEAAESYTDQEPFTDDTPIDIIELPNIGLPPIIGSPSADYPLPAEAAADGEPDIQADEPAETATGAEQDIPLDGPVETPLATDISAAENDDLPFDDDLPSETLSLEAETAAPIKKTKPKAAIIDSRKAETSVMDVMADKQAWRRDRPGSRVKNVISAISLNDRVLLINVLFREDPALFQDTISAFNGMATLDEATDYIQTNFPEWDLSSEPVYRLMMAVRRKLS